MKGRNRFPIHKSKRREAFAIDAEKRSFLKGAGAAVAFVASESMNAAVAGVGGLALVSLFEQSGIPHAISRLLATRNEQAPNAENRLESLRASEAFNTQIRHYTHQFSREHAGSDPNSDLERALYYGCQPTLHDAQGRSRIDYFGDEVMSGVTNAQMPEVLREELSFLLVGLPAVETRYHNNLISSAGAERLVQAMPATRRRFGIDEHEIRYLENQVLLVREHFIRDYGYFASSAREELAVIRDNYFDGDEEKFQREFVSLLLINSYNGGSPLIREALTKFTTAHPQGNERGYDVYEHMARWAKDNRVSVRTTRGRLYYGDDSRKYSERVFAFALLLRGCDTRAR